MFGLAVTSIVEGVQKDIDIGEYSFRAKSISVSEFSSDSLLANSLVSSNTGLLYADDEGKIVPSLKQKNEIVFGA